MDAVYILGTDSPVENLEILYSVRSLETHMADLRNVYVVGDLPANLPGVIHVPAIDETPYKWKNAYLKIKKACEIPELSEEFLLMNDDFYMLEPFEGADWPFYANNRGSGGTCGPINFAVHCPIRYKKEWFGQMPFSLDGKGPHSPRCMYGNFYKAPPTMGDDFIVRAGKGMRPLVEQVAGRPCFSTSNASIQFVDVQNFLKELYPIKSRFE